MIWKVVVRSQAIRELTEAATWYERQRADLGEQFIASVETALANLAQNPKLNSRRLQNRDVRYLGTERFPYRLVYEIKESDRTVVVAAVLHNSRHDLIWRHRLSEN